MISKNLRKRFFNNKFSVMDSCWVWHRGKTSSGYGLMYVRRGYAEYAHRISYEIHHDINPAKMDVCHKCDNPACVNPQHLFLGTAKDNALDMLKKGRGKNKTHLGATNGNSSLKADQVLEMRRLMNAGESTASVGRKFGVAQTTASCIHLRKTWKHI